MKVFLVDVRDDDFCKVLPERLKRPGSDPARVQVMAFPPLGIQTLAPVLRQRGHEVQLFDTCHPRMKAGHIAEAAATARPGVIGLSFLSATTYPAAKALARQLKQRVPDTSVIVGGPFVSMNAACILRDCPEVDSAGVGEGEELLPDYLEHLDDPGQVAGLVWRRGDTVVRNAPRPLLRDLDAYPYPDRASLPIDYIESLPLDVPAVLSLDKFGTLQTSRGCPFSCIYCDIPSLAEGRWRSRSPARVLGEMQELHAQGHRSVFLTDDHFLVNRQRVTAICQGMIERRFQFRWGCEGRVDATGVEMLALMRQANCEMLAFGVEAGTQKTLDRLHKRQTLAQVERAVAAAKRHGIARVHGFFVIGCPGETEADIQASFRFAARLELDTFGFNRLCAYRGTPLWQEYVERGLIDDERDWHKWFKCSDIDPTTLPGAVVNRARMKGYARLFAHRLLRRPLRTARLLRAFGRHMTGTDMLRLLASPFRRRALTRPPDLPARMLELGLREPIRPPAGLVAAAAK
jgi:radical SAM superfamily enzyme YgiQ (UPF0313 family)